MTSTEPWDDERLTAAFAAYVGSAPPADGLAASTSDAVRGQRRATRAWWRRPIPALLAGGTAMVALVLGVQLLGGSPDRAPGTGTPPESAAPTVPSDDAATVEPIGDVRGGWLVTFPTTSDLSRTVTVIDRTGTLLDVRLATVDERRRLPLDPPAMTSLVLDETTTLVGWGGSLCELEQGLEVTDTAARTLTLSGRADALCRAALVTTAIVLLWSEPVADVRVTDARAADPFPTAVAGVPTMRVADALAVRAEDDDREIAVKGWLTLDARSDCGSSDLGPLLDPGCRSPARAGTLRGEDGDDQLRFVTPGPDDLVTAADEAPVVLIGHFDDARAVACPDVVACRDTLYVDAVWVDGRQTAGHWSWAEEGATPPFTPDVINRLLPSVPSQQTLSVGTLDGARLPLLEPMAAGSRAASEPWVWHVTRLVEDRIRTYVVTHAQALAFVETADRRYFQEMADGRFVELTAGD